MALAFFDLDKTLIAENSAKLWLNEQWQSRRITWPNMLKASYFLLKYHLGFTKMEEVVIESVRSLKGFPKSDFLDDAAQFFHDTVRHLYRPGAIRALERHRALGHKISLITSSFDGLSYLVQNDLNLDYCLCTELEADATGVFTGNTLGPPCFGANKVLAARNLCRSLNLDLKDCTFYTDSASDMPLMKVVGEPVAVNPDLHLRARAQVYAWKIVDWGRPGDR